MLLLTTEVSSTAILCDNATYISVYICLLIDDGFDDNRSCRLYVGEVRFISRMVAFNDIYMFEHTYVQSSP